MPESSTAISNLTEYWCNRLKDTRMGSPGGAALTDPICSFNTSIRAITPYCEAIVQTIMKKTSSAESETRAPTDFSRTAVASKNTTPAKIPIVCNLPSAYPTRAPVKSLLFTTGKIPAVKTKKYTMLPTQVPNENICRNRRVAATKNSFRI